MSNSKKVNENLSIAGQVTPEELQQAAQLGFKSVLNLRSPDEVGVLADEQQQTEDAGLEYVNVPLKASESNRELTEVAIKTLDDLPKPVLIHCGAGARAGGIALIATAINQGLTYEQIALKAQELGIDLEQPHLKQFIQENYTAQQSQK